MTDSQRSQALLRKASWLSFWVGVGMLAIKVWAWWLTRVVGDPQ